MNAQERILKTIQKILLCYPEFGYFTFGWEIKEKKEFTDTMAVNYDHLLYNSDFVMQLNNKELGGVLIHEIVHCLFWHPSELAKAIASNKNLNLWTTAMEIATNDEVLNLIGSSNSSFFALPGGPTSPHDKNATKNKIGYLYDSRYKGKDTLQIYKDLMKNLTENESCPEPQKIANSCLEGDVIPCSSNEKEQAAKEKTIAVIEKALQAGRTTNGTERLLKILKKSTVPFERILYTFCAQTLQTGANDLSWLKNDQRHPLSDDIFIPGYIDNEMKDPIIVIDTSGSISSEALETFASGIAAIKTLTEKVTVITTDTEIHEKITVHSINDILSKIKFKGGGGTDFNAVFNEIKKCNCMIFFTDGYASYPLKPPSYPVFWVLTTEHSKPPFGKVAYIL